MVQVLAMLYAGKNGIDGLSSFEAKVIPLIIEHGGTVLCAFRPEKPVDDQQSASACSEKRPDEIHVLQFPSHECLANYRSDSRLLALQSERSVSISKTELLISESIVSYDIDGTVSVDQCAPTSLQENA